MSLLGSACPPLDKDQKSTANGGSHKCKGTRQGWGVPTWGSRSRQVQATAKQNRAGLKRAKQLLGSSLDPQSSDFIFRACRFRSLLHIPPSVSEEATSQCFHKQPRITILLHGLTFAWARAATAKRFLWVEKPLLLLLCLWTHFISLIKRGSSYPCLRQGGVCTANFRSLKAAEAFTQHRSG